MAIAFPGESAEYRAARNRLLEQEIELRRAMEAVAAARRGLPPGGIVPQDYIFQAEGPGGSLAEVRLSELFAPGRGSLVIYSMMFPRASDSGARKERTVLTDRQRTIARRVAEGHRLLRNVLHHFEPDAVIQFVHFAHVVTRLAGSAALQHYDG